MQHRLWMTALSVGMVLSIPLNSSAAIITFDTVAGFRAQLGEPNNANSPGPLASGRREINWDGGAATVNAPGGTPFTVFFNTRGALIETPGTGFVQVPVIDNPAAPNGVAEIADVFGNLTYNGQFTAFSPVRVFNPVGSNITDVTFIVPGTSPANDPTVGTRATVSGFGSVFSGVDSATSTRIEFYDILNNLLFSGFVPISTVANGNLSFLGAVATAGERIARVRIVTGNAALGANVNEGLGTDLVVMDDFLYSEPQQIPEPLSVSLLALGFGAVARRVHRRRAQS
jgi:hypothetical protein